VRRAVSAGARSVRRPGAAVTLGTVRRECRSEREERSDSDITMGIDHYAMQAALALVLYPSDISASVLARQWQSRYSYGRSVRTRTSNPF